MIKKTYDVLIIGGGTAGCACAWNCAKLGLKTLLIEKESYLGGTMTGALVVPVMKSGENQINTDFYQELIHQMSLVGGQVTYQGNKGWFNPFLLKDVLFKMLKNAGVEIKLLTNFTNVIYNNKRKILSVNIESVHTDNVIDKTSDILSVCIEAEYYVDTTGNLNFSQKINCEFLPNNNELPPLSLRFVMNEIDLKTFGNWLLSVDKDRNVTTVEQVDNQIHLSTAYTWDTDKHWALAPYFDKAVELGELKDTDRNYFQVFSIAGMPNSLAFNCPRIIKNVKNPYKYGKVAIKRIANFCIKYFPGFEKAKVYKIADKLGIRANNRIRGKYIYTIEDLRSGKKFKNPAVISNYPVDVHSRKKNNSILENTCEYQLPIESLMSADYENLFVAGRCLSADEMAQGALRVQASCFSMGEAVAKYIKSII